MDKNMKIVVTGGSGLVGNHLKKIMPDAIFLSSKDYNLVLESEVIRLYKELDPDYVIHLAARVGGIIDNINHPLEYFEDNLLMNTLMVKYARLNRVKRFLGVLSSCIFPDTVDEYPMKEDVLHDGPPTKTNFSYGMAKRSLAVQIDTCNEQYGTNYSYISPCNLYGESDKDDENRSHFVTALIKKIFEANKNNEDHITLYGNGEPLRQFIHANDIANVIKIIIDRDITESFNLATEENITINQIAEIALEATNSKLEIRYDKSKPNGQYRKDLDITKFRKLIPDYKFITLKEGIKSHYNTYED